MLEEQKNNDIEPIAPEESNAGPINQEEKNIKKYLSHDGLFRFAFENKHVAESFARENLPGEITANLDFSTLTQDKDTFVDQKLSRCYADVLYHIRPAQLRDAIDEVLEEGGAMMSTVFQQLREESKEIGLMEGKEIGLMEGKEIGLM